MIESQFKNYEHAIDFDRRSRSDIRMQLADKLIDALDLEGDELVLDLATGTGRFARPVSRHLPRGTIVGVDESLVMFRVSRESDEGIIPRYQRVAGTAEFIPLADDSFARAWVAFSLHHFQTPAQMVGETHRVLKTGGRLFVLDPVVPPAGDATDTALNSLINHVFQRSHGASFQFFTVDEICQLLREGGLSVVAAETHSYSVDQDGTEGIPTGRHWTEVIDELEKNPADVKARFQQQHFEYEKHGDTVHIKGRFHYGLVAGEKQR